MSTFSLEVTYAQVAVFDTCLKHPFNDWSDEHVAQGFAWRPGSVSFSTLEPAGELVVRVERSAASPDVTNAERAISVPFSVPIHGAIEIATIARSFAIEFVAGEYELSFVHGRRIDGTMTATFHFRPVESQTNPKILRADSALAPAPEFVMNAHPA
ncbi:MAG TPA: competence protein ComJ [Polyangium sp.]|nr:competence protein ComJ [Polyangium sp.]